MSCKIDFIVLDKVDLDLLQEAVSLHIKHLSYRSFITLFGNKFLLELYKDILSERLGFFVFAMDEKKICGFVLGCVNSRQLLGIIKRKLIKYFAIILPILIINLSVIFKLFETLFYVKKENSRVQPELIVIVTDSNYRSAGIGSSLVSALNEEFRKRNIYEYKVTVHDEMKQSNNFYVKNGMTLSNSFIMYGVKWNLYTNLIKR
jgi:GNAT superfamily N-acetyltransferase